MKRILFQCLPVTMVLLLSACATQPQPAQDEILTVNYQCGNHQPIRVRYFTQLEQAELVLDGQVYYLAQQPAASGFWYSDKLRSLRGKGEELSLEIGRRAAVLCIAE